MKLTDAAVTKLKLATGQDELVVFDDILAGYGFRLRPKTKRWIFRYDIASAAGRIQRKLTLGDFPAVGESKARKLATALHIRVKAGEDPAGAVAENRARASETVGHCVGLFLEHRRSPASKRQIRRSTLVEIERHLTRNLSAIHDMRIDTEPQRMRRAVADELATFSLRHPTQGDRTLASAHQFFKWCISRGFIDINPVAAIERHTKAPRERILIAYDKKSKKYNYEELRRVWHALPEGDFGDIVKLLILTACRREEISQLAWAEIDFEHGVIALPGSRTKNHHPRFVPLSASARAILEGRPQRDGRALVFGRGQRGFSGWSAAKQRLDAASGVTDFVVHDLRRTAATALADIGIAPHAIEAVLGHTSGYRPGIVGTYNKNNYEAEKTNALARWDEHLMAVLADRKSNVASLKRA